MQITLLNDRYELERKIGEGGMARVYRARDRRLDRVVAVKMLHSHFTSDPTFLRRFNLEAQAAAKLQHPGIVEVYDVGQDGDNPYIVMEFVDGSDLKTMLLRGAIPIDETVRIGEMVAEALDVAHRAGLVHRDVKPQNILIGKNGTAKITDFGIAKSSAVSSAMTQTGVVFGTADYISPEQARGERATPRSDIYALGVTLYETLTGRLPFSGDSAISVAMQHLNAEPPPPRLINPRIPQRLEAIVLQALSKDPEARQGSASELARQLRDYRNAIEQDTVGRTAVAPAPRPPATAPNPAPVTRTPRAPLPARRALEPPPRPSSRGLGFGSVLLGLVIVAGVLGLIVLGASGLFSDMFSFALGQPRSPVVTTVGPAPGASPLPTLTTQVQTPNVTGLDRQQALDELQRLHLLAAETEPRNSDVVTAGLVLEQIPRAGVTVGENSVVTITLSLGTDAPQMPDVTGRRQDDAQRLLESTGFKVVVVEAPDREISSGYVIRTDPAYPVRPPRGETVTVYVSVGDRVRMPDVAGKSLDEATRQIQQAGLFVSYVDQQGPDKIPNFDQIPPNTVVSSEPRGNEWVAPGTGVTLGVRRE